MRQCGHCTLCCRLLPQRELAKAAGQRCQHQRHTGCSIYAKRPPSCRLWSCQWLLEVSGTERLSRPDHSHYVIDQMPDYVTAVREDGFRENIPVVQVWVDPRHRDAHRDPQLRAFIDAKGIGAIIRYDSNDGFVIFPPSLTGGGWVENHDGVHGEEHSAAEKFAVMPDLVAGALR